MKTRIYTREYPANHTQKEADRFCAPGDGKKAAGRQERLLEGQEIHRLLADMLAAFADYCDRHTLRYYLVGGTLLGAVRHKGFIPWDDDIDVGMPRPDYERFLELVKEEPVGAEYEVVSAKAGDFTLPFAEMCHKNTRVERPSSEFIDEAAQILRLVLDIFPQDGWPEDKRQSERVVKYAAFLRFLNKEARAKPGEGKTPARKVLKIPMILIARSVGTSRILKKLDSYAQTYKYDNSRYVGAVTYGIYGLGERCLREEVIDFAQVEFEGRTFCAPGCWDSYLTGIYGDYMTLPPEEKRVSHGLRVWLKEDSDSFKR